MNLHTKIMELAPNPDTVTKLDGWEALYLDGHKDARHAAAELSLKADAEHKEMLEALIAILPYISMRSAADGSRYRCNPAVLAAVLASDKVREALRMVCGDFRL